MKRFVVAVTLLANAVLASAGVTYSFESRTTGASPQLLRGSVHADSGRVRIDISAGDDLIFKSGTYVISTEGARSLQVMNPAARTYYLLDASNLFGSAGGSLSQLRGLVDFTVRKARADVADLGPGPVIESFPTRRAAIDTSCELVMDLFGQTTAVPIRMHTEVWSTDRLPASLAGVLDFRGLRTGIEAVDKLLASRIGNASGFPLKQVTTTDVVMNGRTSRSTTTTSVKNVKQTPIDPAVFAMPAGYAKVPNPIEELMQQFGVR